MRYKELPSATQFTFPQMGHPHYLSQVDPKIHMIRINYDRKSMAYFLTAPLLTLTMTILKHVAIECMTCWEICVTSRAKR